jgi:hypothetical protein
MNRQASKEQREAPMIKPSVGFCVGAGDPAALLEPAEQLVGKTVVPPAEIPDFGLTFAFFADPRGHVVGLSKGAVP